MRHLAEGIQEGATWGLLIAGLAFAAFLAACRSSAPIAPPYPDADAACVVDRRITEARLIRTADGSALTIACPDGGAQ